MLQVVTFAIPHDKLGEEVGAAVMLREGQTIAERDLRAYVATRLVDFKVPRKIVFLDEIPKGATGKAPEDRPRAEAGPFRLGEPTAQLSRQSGAAAGESAV